MKRSALILIATLGLPCSARADTPEIEALIKKGVELRRSGKDQEALDVFKQAYDKSHSPKAQAQLGLAEQALGRWVEAEADLLGALASQDPWVAERKGPLSGAVDEVKTHLGSLELVGGEAGAKIRVNGDAAGALPLDKPLRVVAGSIALEISLDGYYPVSRTVAVPAGGLARESIKLVPAVTASAPPPKAVEPPQAPPPATTGAVTQPAASDDGPPYEVMSLAALGVGVAGVATGVIGLVLREGHASKWNSDACIPNNGTTREQNCADEKSGAETGGTIATIGFIAGGVGLAASAVFWFVLRPDETTPVASVLVGEHGTLGLGLSGRF